MNPRLYQALIESLTPEQREQVKYDYYFRMSLEQLAAFVIPALVIGVSKQAEEHHEMRNAVSEAIANMPPHRLTATEVVERER